MSRYQPGAVARAGIALSFGLVGVALFHVATSAQDRLKTMPGYAQYQKASAQPSLVPRRTLAAAAGAVVDAEARASNAAGRPPRPTPPTAR